MLVGTVVQDPGDFRFRGRPEGRESDLLKRCNFLILTLHCSKFNQENMYRTLSESASFCKRYDKTFWCVYRFTVLTAVHLRNANTKFHKVR